MTDKVFKRKLSAIFSADVQGYSRLMGEDEDATVRMLIAHREVLTALIQQNNGRVIDSPGGKPIDGPMSEDRVKAGDVAVLEVEESFFHENH